MAEHPNDASRKSKAEGDRPGDGHMGDGAYLDTDERSGSIANRSKDEETSSRQTEPRRGQAKCGPPGGLGDPDLETRRSGR